MNSFVLVFFNSKKYACRGCTGCFNTSTAIVVAQIAMTLIITFTCLFFLYKFKNHPDNFGVLTESYLGAFWALFTILGLLLDNFVQLQPNSAVTFNFMIVFGLVMLIFVQTIWQVATGFYLERRTKKLQAVPRSSSTRSLNGNNNSGRNLLASSSNRNSKHQRRSSTKVLETIMENPELTASAFLYLFESLQSLLSNTSHPRV